MELDDPIIHSAERTGYPPWHNSQEPICPVCHAECDTVYKDMYGEIIGCDICLTAYDAWEEDECMSRWYEE